MRWRAPFQTAACLRPRSEPRAYSTRVPGAHLLPDPGERRHRMRRLAVIVAQQHFHRIRVRSDHRDGFRGLAMSGNAPPSFFSSTMDLRATSSASSWCAGAVVHAVRNPRPAHHLRRIEHAELEARRQQPAQGRVHIFFRQQPLSHGGHDVLIFQAAVQIACRPSSPWPRLRRRSWPPCAPGKYR